MRPGMTRTPRPRATTTPPREPSQKAGPASGLYRNAGPAVFFAAIGSCVGCLMAAHLFEMAQITSFLDGTPRPAVPGVPPAMPSRAGSPCRSPRSPACRPTGTSGPPAAACGPAARLGPRPVARRIEYNRPNAPTHPKIPRHAAWAIFAAARRAGLDRMRSASRQPAARAAKGWMSSPLTLPSEFMSAHRQPGPFASGPSRQSRK